MAWQREISVYLTAPLVSLCCSHGAADRSASWESVIIRTILIPVAHPRPAAASLHAPVPGLHQTHVGFAVLERYHRELLNFLTRQVNDRDTAADLTQESFVRVLSAQSSGQAVLKQKSP